MAFRKIYPPHPDQKMPWTRLGDYEMTNEWCCQRKFNGTHITVHISEDRKVNLLTRHATPSKLFTLTKDHVKDLTTGLNLEQGKEYLLNAELLDHKTTTPQYKGKIVIFDILSAGKYLFRTHHQMTRLKLLEEICGNPTKLEPHAGIALQVTERVWLAQHWLDNFVDRFKDFLHMPEIEGLILRKRNSFIENFGYKEYQVPWILRVRKPHGGGNYDF